MAARGEPERLVDGLLGVREIFGEDLPESEHLRNVLYAHLAILLERGALEAVRVVLR